MGILSAGVDWIMGFLGTAVPFLAVLTLIVFIHELGHFLVARWCGVNVETFSVGFGRAITSWYDRRGTQWKIGWIPLGGYVKFQGDANAASLPADSAAAARPGDFHTSSVARRAAIVVAGPVANFVLAIGIFAASFAIIGQPISPPVVEEVRPDSAAEAAGILPGDRITMIDGNEITSFTQIQRWVADRANQELAITIERDGREVTASDLHVVADERGDTGALITGAREYATLTPAGRSRLRLLRVIRAALLLGVAGCGQADETAGSGPSSTLPAVGASTCASGSHV